MKIAGYSPYPGHGSVTSSLVAIGAMCAAIGMKVVLLDSQWEGGMSMSLLPGTLTKKQDYLSTTGIDEIIRLWIGNGLNEESIKGGVISIEENLDLISHSTKPVKAFYEKQFIQCLPKILTALEQQYDVILMDQLTDERSRQQRVLELADRIYIFLPQNNWLLRQYFKNPIQNSNIFYIFAQYEPHSMINPFNLKMRYKELRNKSVQTIPFNAQFLDSWSGGWVCNLLNKYKLAETGDKNYRFIHSLEVIAKSIKKGAKCHD